MIPSELVEVVILISLYLSGSVMSLGVLVRISVFFQLTARLYFLAVSSYAISLMGTCEILLHLRVVSSAYELACIRRRFVFCRSQGSVCGRVACFGVQVKRRAS